MTRKLLALLCLTIACLSQPSLANQTARDKAARLLELNRTGPMVTESLQAIENQLLGSSARALEGRTLSAEQREQFTAANQRMIQSLQKGLTWETLRPLYIELYSEIYSEQELDDMIAFLSTPAGQAMVNKMPALMQRSMALTSAEMNKVLPAVRQQFQKDLEDIGIVPKRD